MTKNTQLELNNYESLIYDSYERELLTMLIADENEKRKEIAIKGLKPEMFKKPENNTIFLACSLLFQNGEKINKYSVCEVINNTKMTKYIESLYSDYITGANYVFFVKKLQQRYKQEQISLASTFEDFERVKEEEKLYTIADDVYVPIQQRSESLIMDYFESTAHALRTGYKSIDAVVGTLQGGDYIILAAQTSMGKTAMALNLAVRVAKQGYKVDICSLEMSRMQIQNRIICAETGLQSFKFRNFEFSSTELEVYQRYVGTPEFDKLGINISADYDMTIDKICSEARKSDADLFIIDYLGLISGGNGKTSYERYGDISRQLKLLSLEINRPVIVLHQLNRAIFDRQDKRPRTSDLRDCGKIEQDADMICFVHRPAYYDPQNENPELMEFIVAKNRNGKSNQICNLRYEAEIQRISDYDER